MHSVCILIYVFIQLPMYTRYIWTGSTRWLSAIRGAPEDDDRVNSEIHFEAVIERVWICTWRPRWSEHRDALGGRDLASLEMHLESQIQWTHRCTWRPWLSEFGDAIGDRDWVNSEMHWEAVIEWVWRCTWRPRSSELRDALGGRDWASLEMQLETEIEWTQRYTPRPWSSEFGDPPVAGYDRARLEKYLEVVDLKVVDLEAVNGRRARCWDSIHQLVNSKLWEWDEVTLLLKLLWRTGWWRSIGREVCRWLKLHSGVNSKSREWKDDRQS